ncbi:amino acid adenylation domain-containing protein [Micromonospora sp. NPDC050397]|uniref:amino acid adenylation domain-containing protein n=1 Tax=Micromonospora sp. NPDC050397 TaxID=3364279 RepID=UPI00384ABF69
MPEARWPLSAAQSGVWFDQRLDPENPAYNIGGYIEVDGVLDPDLMATATRHVVAETEALRLRFVDEDGEPGQVVGPAPEWSMPLLDLTTEPDPDSAALAWMCRDMDRPVDPVRGPLFTMALLRTGPERYVYYQRIHHVALDGHGYSQVGRRVGEWYTAIASGLDAPSGDPPTGGGRAGRESPAGSLPAGSLPAGSLPAVWAADDAYRASPAFARDREFWRARLADLPAVVDLSAAAVPPVRTGPRTARRSTVPPTHWHGVADRDRWPAVVLATAAVYLHRLTGAPEIVLGFPVTGRWGGVARRTPSMTANILPIRLSLRPDTRFRTLVELAGAEISRVLRRQRFRMSDLRSELRTTDDRAKLSGPVVNIMPFDYRPVFLDYPTRSTSLGVGPVDDVTIDVYGTPETGVRISFIVNPERYDPETALAHQERFVRVLDAVHTAPDVRVAQIDMLDRTTRDGIMEISRGARRRAPASTVAELFEEQVARTPRAPALISGADRLTYAELNTRANRLAAELLTRGAGPEQFVALALPRSVDLVVALLAVLKTGAGYLPIEPADPPDRNALMLADARPALTLTDRAGVDALPPAASPMLVLDEPATARSIAARPAHGPDHRHREAAPGSDHPAYLLYTSGSTGRPKGVPVPHRGVVNHLRWMSDRYGLNGDDRVLVKTHAGFDVSVWEFLWPLLVGARAVLARPDGHRDPGYLVDLIRAERITTVVFVPSMLHTFLWEPGVAECRSLRRTLCIGEALPAELAHRAAEVLPGALENLYGPTEASVAVTAWRAGSGDDPAGVPIGRRPAWNTGAYVLDHVLAPVGPGVVGELYLSGDQLARGYLHRPGLTATRFVADPYSDPGGRMYRTGDLVRRLPGGELLFVGRTDDQIKIRGNRVEPGEIESALAGHPEVGRAVVLARPDQRGERHLVAYVVPARPAEPPKSAVLRAHLATRLPRHMVPDAFLVLDTLPTTPNGKLDRRRLPDAEAGVPVVGRAPRTRHEVILCGLFADLLELPLVGVDDNFFDLGGHSLRAARLVSRIRTALGVELDIRAVFETPTVAALAERLSDAGRSPDGVAAEDAGHGALDVVLPLRVGGDRPPLFCFPPVNGLSWCYSGLLRHLEAEQPVYGLQARGLSGPGPLAGSVEEMAADFAEQIVELCPSGPYRLLGWSLGGILAYATAARLRRLGRRVELLGLLDAYPADPELHTEEHRRVLLNVVLADFGYDPGLLDGQPLDDEHVVGVIRRAGGSLADWSDERVAALLRVTANNLACARRYRPDRFDGDLLFFTARLTQAELRQSVTDWHPYVAGRIDNREIDCRHEQMLRTGPVADLAPLLAARLGALDRSAPGAEGPAGAEARVVPAPADVGGALR